MIYIKNKFFAVLILIFFFNVGSFCQTKEEINPKAILPTLTEPVGCELNLLYIDHSLGKVSSTNNSILILIVKLGENEKKSKLTQTRVRNIKNYLKLRGFNNSEVVVGDKVKGYGKIELYVDGILLYAIPIKNNDNFEILRCA